MDQAEIKRIFRMFDHNGDGNITKQELTSSLQNLGIYVADTDLTQMIEKIDVNGDGYVDINEFIVLYQALMAEEDEEEENMLEAFSVFDQNGDGFITVEELRSVLQSLGMKGRTLEDCKKMINKVDIDGDGIINYNEFKQMMKGDGFSALGS